MYAGPVTFSDDEPVYGEHIAYGMFYAIDQVIRFPMNVHMDSAQLFDSDSLVGGFFLADRDPEDVREYCEEAQEKMELKHRDNFGQCQAISKQINAVARAGYSVNSNDACREVLVSKQAPFSVVLRSSDDVTYYCMYSDYYSPMHVGNRRGFSCYPSGSSLTCMGEVLDISEDSIQVLDEYLQDLADCAERFLVEFRHGKEMD